MTAQSILEQVLQQGSPFPVPFEIEPVGRSLDQLRADILGGTWSEVADSSARCLSHATGILNGLMTSGASGADALALLNNGLLLTVLTDALRRDDGDSIRQALVEAIENSVHDVPVLKSEIIADLNAIADGSLGMVDAIFGNRPGPFARTLEPALALFVRGLLGRLHVSFNESYDTPPLLPGASEDAKAAAIANVIKRNQDKLTAVVARLSEACQDPHGEDDIVDAALALQHYSARAIPRISRSLSHLRRMTDVYLADGLGEKAKQLSSLSIQGHRLIREIVAASVAAVRLAVDQSEDVVNVRESAGKLPFNGELPSGLSQEISTLSNDMDGALVRIQGRVISASSHLDEAEKLLGHILVQDPVDGAMIQAVGLFINPTRVGITNDSFVSLSGTFHATSTLNSNNPAILIQRLPLSQLANEQWYMAFLRLAFGWYPVFRNGHNLSWSLGPHSIENGALDSSQPGAAELVFLRLGPTRPVEEVESDGEEEDF